MRHFVFLALLGLFAVKATADTTITYQGQLQGNGQPFDGQLDMTFELFDNFDPDDASVGSSVAGPIAVNDVEVSNGMFQVDLDFGAFYEQPAWIEITIGTDTLHPRQRLTSAPVAVHALNVSSTAGAWMLGGNAGSPFDFLGTIDEVPLNIRVDNRRALRIEPASWESPGGTLNFAPNWIAGTSRNSVSRLAAGATIAGGGRTSKPNTIDADFGTIGGGQSNWVYASNATIAGGSNNTAGGKGSSVPGGYDNDALGDFSFAAGHRAKIDEAHTGTFLWADSTDADFSSTGQNQFLIRAGGGVGIGTNAPRNQLDVMREQSGSSLNANHVMTVHNIAASQGNVLALQTDADTPSALENFITFKSGISNVGAIEGDGSGGVTLKSGSADFAEYLPQLVPDESISPADVVGVMSNGVSLRTTDGGRAMVVSTRPIVAGNDPGEGSGDRDRYVAVAFLGQVPVRVTGKVTAGDYLVPSGLDDGTGIGVPPGELSTDQLPQVVGRALESSETQSNALVNTLVGLPQTAIMASVLERRDLQLDQLETRVTKQERQLVGLHTTNAELRHELDRLASHNAELRETVRSLAGAHEQSRELKARIAELEAILLEQSELAGP